MDVAFDGLPLTPEQFLRRAGYGELQGRHATERSWFKRFGSEFYPRYHAYVGQKPDGFVVKLHLDQKRPSYEGTSMHAGEYDGPAVEREAQRLRDVAEKLTNAPQEPEERSKGFFAKLLGL